MNDWVIQLNTNKCTALRYGKGNLKFPHLVKDENNNLKFVEEFNFERDLVVIFYSNLKWTEQIGFCKQS